MPIDLERLLDAKRNRFPNYFRRTRRERLRDWFRSAKWELVVINGLLILDAAILVALGVMLVQALIRARF